MADRHKSTDVDSALVPSGSTELIRASEVPNLLEQIRPAWKAKDLINRVQKLWPVDPSSACQRIFNAAVHDLRDKIVIAGIDIAREAAQQNKLPPIERPEDVEDYPPSKIIDLSYRIGLISRPEWRRLSRVYEIRRDLEHEDDEYQADAADCIYMFKATIEVVLSRDPVQLLRVVDVKEIIEQTHAVVPSQQLLEDYQYAPQVRQLEIMRFLVATALDTAKVELVRQNAFTILSRLATLTKDAVKVQLGTHFQEKVGRRPLDSLHARVAYASGTLGFVRQAQRADFFAGVHAQLEKVTYHWRAHDQHGEVLRNLIEVGGLEFIPVSIRPKIVEWLVLVYLGEPGGYGWYGRNRKVFYSNSAAPLVEDLVRANGAAFKEDLTRIEQSEVIKQAIRDGHVARRHQELLDLVAAHAKC